MLCRLRDRVEVSWCSRPATGDAQRASFLVGAGSASFEVADVAHPLFEVLVDAATYLARLRPHSVRIAKLLERARALVIDDAKEQRLAWRGKP